MGSNRPGVDTAQRWLPDRYARNARFVADLGEPLLDLLKPQHGERILDLGCGDGAFTEKIVASGAMVVGVDAAPQQVAAARARGLDARVMDGQSLDFDGAFDAIVSNAALHWMLRPRDVIAGMWRALKPGGRVAAEMGGKGNVAKITTALIAAAERRGLDGTARMPWYFPDVDSYRARLEAAGFRVDSMILLERPTVLPGDMAAWLETFAESWLLAVPSAMRDDYIDEVCDALRPELFEPEGRWVADYVRLRFTATRPGAA